MTNQPSLSLAEALRAASDTHVLEIGSAILGRTPEYFRNEFGERPAVVVADTNTFAVAGRVVAEGLKRAELRCEEPFIFTEPALYAEHSYVERLTESLGRHQAIPVAVGSGTINDLTKLAAHRVNRPYLCVGTAASMDGYTAYGASITYQGSKQTFSCPAPAAVVADLEVIAQAPGSMNAWGYADLLAKVPAGADWILADALAGEAIDPRAWSIVQPRLRELLGEPEGVRTRQPEAIARLVEGLMLAGFAMQASRSSRAASGAEHQFSHLWDMQHHTHQGRAPSHGFKVGIGTLASTALCEFMLAQPLDQLGIASCIAAWPDEAGRARAVRECFGEGELTALALHESGAKALEGPALRAHLEQLRRLWPELKGRVREQLIPFARLKAMLQDVGAPVEPEQIGITRQRLRDSFRQACFIRRRFTVLDLAIRTGYLDRALDHIFGPQGAWPSQ